MSEGEWDRDVSVGCVSGRYESKVLKWEVSVGDVSRE